MKRALLNFVCFERCKMYKILSCYKQKSDENKSLTVLMPVQVICCYLFDLFSSIKSNLCETDHFINNKLFCFESKTSRLVFHCTQKLICVDLGVFMCRLFHRISNMFERVWACVNCLARLIIKLVLLDKLKIQFLKPPLHVTWLSFSSACLTFHVSCTWTHVKWTGTPLSFSCLGGATADSASVSCQLPKLLLSCVLHAFSKVKELFNSCKFLVKIKTNVFY